MHCDARDELIHEGEQIPVIQLRIKGDSFSEWEVQHKAIGKLTEIQIPVSKYNTLAPKNLLKYLFINRLYEARMADSFPM